MCNTRFLPQPHPTYYLVASNPAQHNQNSIISIVDEL